MTAPPRARTAPPQAAAPASAGSLDPVLLRFPTASSVPAGTPDAALGRRATPCRLHVSCGDCRRTTIPPAQEAPPMVCVRLPGDRARKPALAQARRRHRRRGRRWRSAGAMTAAGCFSWTDDGPFEVDVADCHQEVEHEHKDRHEAGASRRNTARGESADTAPRLARHLGTTPQLRPDVRSTREHPRAEIAKRVMPRLSAATGVAADARP